MKKSYRLGLDLGANSIGWCVLRLDTRGTPAELLDCGVRVYPDGRNPKDGSSLAAQRRMPRSMRRNRDRYLQRRQKLLNALTRFGLMPGDDGERRKVAVFDPYALRAAAVERRLTATELGRVLFHLNQHRGFKSNRKIDRDSNEGGLIKDAASNTLAELQRGGYLTLGCWLASRHANKSGVRVRLAGSGRMAAYPFYPTRAMIEHEFDVIWQAQSGWNAGLTDAMRDALKRIIFDQRRLKPVPVGKCWLEPTEPRAPKALPTAQRYRIAQTLTHLRITEPGCPDRLLTDKERGTLAGLLYAGQDLTLDRVRKLLGILAECDFNTRDSKLTGCATTARLAAKRNPLIPQWPDLDLPVQNAVTTAICEAETDEQAIAALIALGIEPTAAKRAAGAVLPDGHASLSVRAMSRILPRMEAGERYDQAVRSAGYAHHSDRRTGEIRDCLPYYGELLCDRMGTGSGEPGDPEEKRFGRAPNPTVHVALNELRRVVNAIVERHGRPTEIVVETLRDLGRSKKQREAYEKLQRANREANDRRREQLAEMGLPATGRNRMRLRLWEEQASDPKNRVCPYSGVLITPRTALSDEIEEDHILPFAVSLDDSAANRMLVTREANRAKARRAPFEAFGHTKEWPTILQRVALLPPNKRWRFQPDALHLFDDEDAFLSRHVTDSATIARWAKDYLEVLAPGKVWSTPGKLTAMLRQALGLNPEAVLGKGGHRKDRNDHRHHAIDAVIVGLTDRGLLKRVTDAAKRADERGDRVIVALDPPWPGFVEAVAAHVRRVIVSHKPDTGWQGALHNDTAYGLIADVPLGAPNVVVRRPVESLSGWTAEDARQRVRDPVLAARVASALAADGVPARKVALAAIEDGAGHAVRRVRTVEVLESVQPIADRLTGTIYKVVKRDGNHRAELWRLPNGSVKLCIVSTFEAARQAEAARLGRPAADRRPHPAAKLLMRLHKNDALATGPTDAVRILRVIKMSGERVILAPHQEAGNLKQRDAAKDDAFKYVNVGASRLATDGYTKVHVTADGRVLGLRPP